MSWKEQRPGQRTGEKEKNYKKLYIQRCKLEDDKQQEAKALLENRVEQGNRAATNSVLSERDVQGQESALAIHDSLQGRRDHLLHVCRRSLELKRAEEGGNENLELQYSYISLTEINIRHSIFRRKRKRRKVRHVPRRQPMQFLGPSQKVTRPLHP